MTTNKTFIVAVALSFLLFSHHFHTVAAQTSVDCYDGCTMGCINQNQRLEARCVRKCRIRCDPAVVKTEEERLG